MKGKLHELYHEKSGAKLVWLDRPDENMTFGIGFQTIPTDSTGVFHILEHSVLGGSDKYPVKEPFVELLKSSLQTFLNAMTFPDKTVYPFSSRNKQDFLNLMDIYMDAVLHPIAVHDEKVFRQEGWRFEVDESSVPMYQGVVYNEMKGAYSDVRAVLEHQMNENLFPDTCYRHECGGIPEEIPDLSYEQFVQSHATYYHPSNALIVLDGSVDLDACLELLDNYLKLYSRQEMVFTIPHQQEYPFKKVTQEFEIGPGEDMNGRTILSWGKLACTYDEPEIQYGLSILCDYLCGDNESPLKRAVLSRQLGQDMSMRLHDGIQQAWVGWELWNTEEEQAEPALAAIRTVLEQQIAEGLDRERLEACCNSLAFQLANRDGMGIPRGIMEALNILEPWLYGGDPAQNMGYEKVLTDLRARISTGWFEDLIRTHLLDGSSGVLLTLKPSQTLGEQRVEAEKEKLAHAWDSLSEAQKDAVKAKCEAIRQWQQTPDTREALATIPVLTLADLKQAPKALRVEISEVEGIPVLTHETDSSLAYVNLHFAAADLSSGELPALTMLCNVLGKFATENHTGAQLQVLTKQKIGQFYVRPEVSGCGKEKHRLHLVARAVFLKENLSDAVALITEILTQTKYDNMDSLGEILRQNKNQNQMQLISGGNRFAASRVAARQTSAGAARELLSGCEYIRWVNEACDADGASVLETLQALAAKLFVRKRLTVSVSTNAEAAVHKLADAFPSGSDCCEFGQIPVLAPCKEGILIPAGVSYVAKGANVGSFGGSTYVLANLLTFSHLWNEVRVQGGAYGTGFFGSDNGDMTFYSYRDPNPVGAVRAFDASADFVDSFIRSGENLDKYILGAMSEADPLLGAGAKLQLAESRYFKGVTYEDTCHIHAQLCNTSQEDLSKLLEDLRLVADSDNYCIVGGQEILDACKDSLTQITQILT